MQLYSIGEARRQLLLARRDALFLRTQILGIVAHKDLMSFGLWFAAGKGYGFTLSIQIVKKQNRSELHV